MFNQILYGDGYTFILFILALILVMGAQAAFRSTFNKYQEVESTSNLTGEQVAYQILQSQGITDVSIYSSGKSKQNYYDPTKKIIKLEESVFTGKSVTALAVASHEVGHAIQHYNGNKIMTLRNKIAPASVRAGSFGYAVVFIGLLLAMPTVAYFGIGLLLILLAFQLVTLPIEFDASNKAITILNNGIIYDQAELAGAKKVLTAAAFTYVAAVLASVLQILRLARYIRR